MEGLPFLPGNTFSDPTRQKYHVSQTLSYKNGYARQTRPEVGIGGRPIHYNQLSQSDLDQLANFNPILTYGQAKQNPPEDFIPAHVAWDKKVLRFDAFYKQTVHESPQEYYRVRPVVIYYYLEDDSIAVNEPRVDNSGMPQGMLIRRQRLPKNERGDNWHWKDINIGVNITFYGKVFRVVSCDKFTSDFLESQGIVVNPEETTPPDPYIEHRRKVEALPTYSTPCAFDKLKQFLELDRKVLRFYCLWDDRINMFGDKRRFIVQYFLSDDTIEVREMYQPNDGRDPFPVLIRRHRFPKDRYDVPSSYPSVAMELTDNEIKEYLTPKDFKIGETVNIYGRKFLVYDCDDFTKAFYYHHFGITDFPTVDVKDEKKTLHTMDIPPYNNFGYLEDSLQSCLTFNPRPPKKDLIKTLENHHKVLRFEARLDSMRAEDAGRRFIISYRLADDMITIYEPPTRNSGILGGKFLECTRVAKPGSHPNNPDFYGPGDFYIGAVVDIFGHRFVITGADEFVLSFMEKHSNQFPPATVSSIKEQISEAQAAKEKPSVMRTPAQLQQLVQQIQSQLKKIGITDRARVDLMFLRYNKDRRGFISPSDLRHLCQQLNLPVDDDVLNELVRQCTADPEGKIGLEDFRRFVESS